MQAPLFHMGKKTRAIVAIKSPSQKHASHDAIAMAINKKKFLAALAAGMAPGCAAKEIEISRSTAYNWKRDDEEQWEEAVETSLDRLETVMYQVALLRDRRSASFSSGIGVLARITTCKRT